MQALVVLLLAGAASSMRPMRMEDLVMSGSNGSSASSTKLPKEGQKCTEWCAQSAWDSQKDCCDTGLTCEVIDYGRRERFMVNGPDGMCKPGLGAPCSPSTGCGKNNKGPLMECGPKGGKDYCCITDYEGQPCGKKIQSWAGREHSPPNGDASKCCSGSSFEHDGWTLCGPKPSC